MKILFLILWLVIATIGIFFGVIAYKNDDLGIKHDMEISDFHICNSPSDITTQVTSVSQKDIENNSIQLFACGVIKSNKPASLNFYVYEEPSNEPIYQNRPSDYYDPGQFFFPINLDKVNAVGDYRVVVYFYRNIVGTTMFSITE